MSAGTGSVPIGSDLVGQVVDGRFTLQRWLGSAGQGGVFLTGLDEPATRAAIKLIPADAADAESLLAQWTAATSFSHPHLMRLFHAGRCRLNGHDLLYAVTEYSEEFLSEILPARPLMPAEVREMLDPILDALSWLHEHGLVHGGLKPSNVIVVDEQIKLSVDRVQPAGTRGSTSPSSDIHVAPDSVESMSPATDVWSLGVLLVEALTQQTPHRDGTRAADPLVPASVPEPFATIARECLRIYPGRRCSLSEIRSHLRPPDEKMPSMPAAGAITNPQAPVTEAPETLPAPADTPPVVQDSETPSASVSAPVPDVPQVPPVPLAPPVTEAPERPSVMSPALSPAEILSEAASAQPATNAGARSHRSQNETVFATAALILVAAIGALTFILPAKRSQHRGSANHSRAAAPAPSAPDASPGPEAAAGPTIKGAVIRRVLPDVPESASETIRGHLVVVVRVQVDPGGSVSSAAFEYSGRSHYFANLALDAARNWKFKPAQVGGRAVPSSWVLQFNFERSGNDVTPIETAP
ncbi:MAG TPA: TonB family protein [Terracidiphilus sp.]|nr:TonB family protein [Terracidiphilus sp.]